MMTTLSDAFYEAVERRIEWLTLAISAAAAIFTSSRWGWQAGIGIAVGGVLSWLNFRWLDQGVGQLLRAAAGTTESGLGHPTPWIFVRFLARILLMLIFLYVILKTRWLPGKAVLAGFLSLICATVLEVSYEIATGFREPNSRLKG
jgi:ATP synthase I subunit